MSINHSSSRANRLACTVQCIFFDLSSHCHSDNFLRLHVFTALAIVFVWKPKTRDLGAFSVVKQPLYLVTQ
jgi:hypothetical protein